MIVPDPWRELAEGLLEAGEGMVYLAGATDRGKTTCCRYLRETLVAHGTVAWMDCDSGQATLGPPTTIGCEVIGKGRFLRFIGSTSPPGHLLPFLSGAARLRDAAWKAGASYLVIDSPGYVEDPAAQEFQIQLIDLLRPDHLVALQKEREIEPILGPFRKSEPITIHRWTPVVEVRARSREERREYREKRFREYFLDATVQKVSLAGVPMHGRVPSSLWQEAWKDVLLGFLDRERWLLALGVVQSLDLVRSTMRVLVPPFDRDMIASIRIGSMQWNQEEGSEIFV